MAYQGTAQHKHSFTPVGYSILELTKTWQLIEVKTCEDLLI